MYYINKYRLIFSVISSCIGSKFRYKYLSRFYSVNAFAKVIRFL